MTLNKLFGKLRKKNIQNYKQLVFCITFAMVLISSFTALLYSPFIQTTLPVGGDSRKQVYMMLVMAVIGCLVFCIYAVSIFLRYKSKEIGVFLALGTDKKHLRNALFYDFTVVLLLCTLISLLLGNITAFIAGKFFEFLVGVVATASYAPSFMGLGSGLLFCLAVMLCVMILSIRFMKRSNIMDIINTQRKMEPLKSKVSTRYLVTGVCLVAFGIFFALAIPFLVANVFQKNLGAIPNLFYIPAIIGLYQIMVYSVAVHKKGKGNRAQKYYKNIITYGMLKFQGTSVVRNMLIITLLLIAGLFACFYGPSNYIEAKTNYETNPIDYNLRYPDNVNEITKEDIYETAKKYNVTIKDYQELNFIRLLSSGVERDNYDKNGNLIEIYKKEFGYQEYIGVSAYNHATGGKLKLEKGNYKLIKVPSKSENIWNRFDDLDYVQNTFTGAEINLKYDGTANCRELVTADGFNTNTRFVISDEDYNTLSQGLPPDMQTKQLLFNVAQLEASFDFAKDIYKQYCGKASEEMKVLSSYDEFQEQKALELNQPYSYGKPVKLLPENPEVEISWKYEPIFKIFDMNFAILKRFVFILLFIYVAVICLAAVSIISYTRSITVAEKNKQVFDDIQKLGGDNKYIKKILSTQVRKVYVLPTLLGCVIMFLFYVLIMWQNNGILEPYEVTIIGLNFFICIVVSIYQYFSYKLTLKKATALIHLK